LITISKSFHVAKHQGTADVKKLGRCMERALGDVQKVQRCATRFG
jgi:imidazoleglycerol phosphate dehydratase HisB